MNHEISKRVYEQFPVQKDEHTWCETRKKRIERLRKQFEIYLIGKATIHTGSRKGKPEDGDVLVSEGEKSIR